MSDRVVFWAVVWMVSLWLAYQYGYETGVKVGAKDCPPVSQKMLLRSTTENLGGIRCQYVR